MNVRMKIPGPDHPISIAPNPKRVRVTVSNDIIADTTRALVLQEANYPAVLYIPREDAVASKLQRTDHSTFCPYKGDASYFSVVSGGKTLENAVWTYESPYDAMTQISGYLAFYLDKVTIEEL